MRHYCLDWPDLPAEAFRRAPGKNRPATLEGGKGGGSAPSYPDPNVVAQATTSTNENTAAYNKALNLNNYTNPFGSQQSTQVGTDPTTGAPIYNTQISANPALQNQLNSLLGSLGNASSSQQSATNGLLGLQGGYNALNSGLQGVQQGFQANNGNIGALANQYQSLNQNAAQLSGQYQGLQGQLGQINSSINPNAGQAAQQQGQDAAYKAQTQYLDPQFSQQGESLSAQLANQGLTPGSEAYNNAMTNFNNTKQQAYSNAANQAVMTGSQIGAQSLNNQLNAANTRAGLVGQQGSMVGNQAGLLGLQGSNLGQQAGIYGMQNQNLGQQAGIYGQMGSNLGQQGSIYSQYAGLNQLPYQNLSTVASMMPGYSGTAQSASSPADIAGLYNNQYQSKLAGYNAGQSSSNNTMSGLFGLGAGFLSGGGGSSLMSMFSDRRLKRDIRRIGTWANGLGIYTYRYVWEKAGRHIGFMADEVRKVAPAAVVRFADGYDRVNYVLAVR